MHNLDYDSIPSLCHDSERYFYVETDLEEISPAQTNKVLGEWEK